MATAQLVGAVEWAGELVPKDQLPTHLVKMYQSYAFEEYDKRGAFAYDSISEWRETTTIMMDMAWDATSTLPTGLKEQEREFINSMGVCWRLRGMGSLVADRPLIVDNAEQADILRPFLRMAGVQYAAAIENTATNLLREWFNTSTVKVAKGKGAPYWIPGSDPFGAIALGKIAHDSQSVEELNRRTLAAGEATMPMLQTGYMRIQAATSLQPRIILIGGVLHEDGTRRGPKRRKIAAQPFVYNVLWAGVGGVMKELLKRITNRNTGKVETTQENVRNYKFSIAIDLKKFDETVSIQTLDTYRDLVLKPALDALTRKGLITNWQRSMLIELDYETQRLPILLPPWATGWGASVVATEGGISSGERLTAQKGSDINRCRIDAKFDMLGIPGTSTNQGDDTVINSDDRRIDKWMDHPTWAGFTEERAADVSFLMKHMPDGYSYLGRMLMSSINKEASRESPNVIAAASAIAVRRELLTGHPLADEYFKILMRAGQTRTRIATEIAKQHSSLELLRKAFSLPASTDQTEALIEDVERLIERIPTDEDRGIVYQRMIDSVSERFQMQNGQFIEKLKSITMREATRYIRSRSYTRR